MTRTMAYVVEPPSRCRDCYGGDYSGILSFYCVSHEVRSWFRTLSQHDWSQIAWCASIEQRLSA